MFITVSSAVFLSTGTMAHGMDMGGSTATSSSMGSMATDSSASSDMGSMAMNSFLTPKYNNYPVLFDHLRANTKGEAFGIFVLIIAAAFAYKFLLFTSWCLEVKWFKQWNPSAAKRAGSLSSTGPSTDDDDASQLTAQNYTRDLEFQSQYLPKVPNLVKHVMSPSWHELLHDGVRLLLTFCSSMFIYMLMLVAMTFVLTYVFAVILGVSLAEIFFNRWKICLIARWDLQRELERRRNCKGGDVCLCGQHKTTQSVESGPSSTSSSLMEKPAARSAVAAPTPAPIAEGNCAGAKGSCCCAGPDESEPEEEKEEAGCGCDRDSVDQDANNERQARELSKSNEQTGTMDVNLTPAEKFA